MGMKLLKICCVQLVWPVSELAGRPAALRNNKNVAKIHTDHCGQFNRQQTRVAGIQISSEQSEVCQFGVCVCVWGAHRESMPCILKQDQLDCRKVITAEIFR